MYDKDKNDKLNQAEFRMLAKEWNLDEDTADKVLAKYDANGDGEIDQTELRVVINKLRA